MGCKRQDITDIKTYKITKDNLPKGIYWQDDGACFRAELCDIDPADNGWRWVPKNMAALAIGKPNAEMHPFILPIYLSSKQKETP